MVSNESGHYRLRRRYKAGRPDAGTADSRQAQGAVHRIVLTGGPGSGKSTAARFLAREFSDVLWVLPESATLLYRGGLPRAEHERGQQIAQRAIYTVQRSLEDANALRHGERVQLCDRGTIDGAAYWPDGPDDFFRSLGTSHARELSRYDAVIFMHTAAMLPAGYERDLEIRTEDAGEAVELDGRVFELYEPHPRVISVESHASFLDKLTVVRNAVAELMHGTGSSRAIGRPVLGAIPGAGEPVKPAPVSSLVGLASVSHVLPTLD